MHPSAIKGSTLLFRTCFFTTTLLQVTSEPWPASVFARSCFSSSPFHNLGVGIGITTTLEVKQKGHTLWIDYMYTKDSCRVMTISSQIKVSRGHGGPSTVVGMCILTIATSTI